MNKGHSETGASGAYRWMVCPGSVALIRKAGKRPSGKAAIKGTGAHEVLELCFPGGNCEPSDFIDEELTNGYVFQESDVEAVEEAIECLQERSDSIKSEHTVLSEVSFDLTCIHDGLWGTSDTVMAADDMSVLFVDDYKNGVRPVEAEGNRQLLFYGLGAIRKYCEDNDKLDLLEMVGWGGVFDKVSVGIIQPNGLIEGVAHRIWDVPAKALDDFAEELRVKTALTRDPNAPRVAGSHCDWCDAKPLCKEFHGKAQELAKIDFAPTTDPKTITLPDPATMSMEDIVALKAFQGLFKSYFDSIDGYLLSRLRAGDDVPGYKLVRGKTNRKWKDEESLRADLEVLMDNPDALYKLTLITPAKAEKLLGADVVSEFCHKPEGKLTIAPSSDKREAVAVSAKADFSKLTERN